MSKEVVIDGRNRKVTMTFTEFGLKEEVLRAIGEMGFETPTEIQEKALPVLLDGSSRDFVGLAQTGTGKTAAFGLPLINAADPGQHEPAALVLCPTRELCLQISGDLRDFAKNLPGLKVTPVYGGASIGEQIKEIHRGTQIVVATPGRLLDLIRRGKINITVITDLILDEADIMLNMGFKEELDAILEETPDTKRTVLFSATMPPEVARIASDYMHDPVEITVGKKNAGAENIEHSYCMVHSKDKYQALKRLLDYRPDIYGIVFCRTKISTQQIADRLIKDGYNAEALHGDLSQAQRDLVMKKFRSRHVQILVATDVAARGLDVDYLTHIIHYDLPDEPENYIHRSGRTGRVGRKGASIAIINMKEKYKIQRIERKLKRNIDPMKIPDGEGICEQQLIHLIDRVHTVKVDEKMIAPFMPVIEEKLAALDREELLKHFVSLEFNQFLDYYRGAKDINPQPRSRDDYRGRDQQRGRSDGRSDSRSKYDSRGDSRKRSDSRGDSKGSRYEISAAGKQAGKTKQPYEGKSKYSGKKIQGGKFVNIRINLGRKDKMMPPQLIGLIKQSSRMRNIEIGKIDIGPTWSIMQVDAKYAELVLMRTDGFTYRGLKIEATAV